MSFVVDKKQARATIDAAVAKGVCTALFCTGSFWNAEAILRAADNFAKKRGIRDIPVVVAMTSNYAHMPQAKRVSRCGDARIGFRAVMEYCKILTEGPDAPYSNVAAMTHLDHADPALDAWALTECFGLLSSVMFDGQAYPYEENLRLTKEYVERYGENILVEGVVEGLAVGDGKTAAQNDDYIEKAARFVENTNVDFLVADLGTEQQSARTEAIYLGKRAKELTKALGKPMLALHGASSLGDGQFKDFCKDGVIRANMWTRIVRESGKYAAKRLAGRIGRIEADEFEACEATAYINDNIDHAAQTMEEMLDKLGYGALAEN